MTEKLIKRIVLVGPAARIGETLRFEAPAYFERNGLAIHPPWGAWGPDTLNSRPYVLSALPQGWRIGAFRSLADVEGAFVALEALVDWRKVGPTGIKRYQPKTRRAVVAVLQEFGAEFLLLNPKERR